MDIKKEDNNNDFEDEIKAGISEFMCKGEQVRGILKHRYTDFIVNEIDQQNQVIFPTYKQEEIKEQVAKQREEQQQQYLQQKQEKEGQTEEIKSFDLTDQQTEIVQQSLGQDTTEKICKYLSDKSAGDKTNFQLDIESPEEKLERGKIHQCIRENLVGFDSETKSDNGKQFIRIFSCKPNKKTRRDNKKYIIWAKMFKKTHDTSEACFKLAKFIGVKNKNINVAGNKDKRGITTQWVSIVCFNSIQELTQRLQKANFKDNIYLADMVEKTQSLRIGDLVGNRFSLAIRLLKYKKEDIDQNLNQLKEHGFINYYGLQRFGTGKTRTHEIGMEIIKGNWQEAFEKIFMSANYNNNFEREAKQDFLKNRQYKKILNQLPKKQKIERILVESLKKNGDSSYRQALIKLPKNIRDLYVHAFQSFIWNELASFRIKTEGKKVAIGDIVSKSQNQFDEADLDDNDNQNQDDDEDDIEQKPYQGISDFEFEIVNSENISKYSFEDILIPIYGANTKIPDSCNLNEQLEYLLQQYGTSLEDFQKKSEFFVEGGYRYLINKPTDVEWAITNFNKKDQEILTAYHDREKDFNEEDGKYQSLNIKFSLKKGCYATMAIREITKTCTGFEFQSKLNEEFKDF